MVRKLISSLLIAPLIVTGAEAARLSIQGSVIVDRGDGFQPVQGESAGYAWVVPVAPGDRIRVNSGFAEIAYDNGCVVKIGPGQMAAVLYTPPVCRGEITSSASLSSSSSSSSGTSTMTYVYIGGGLLLAGGIGAGAVLLYQNAASP
jgi:hypothetical protein